MERICWSHWVWSDGLGDALSHLHCGCALVRRRLSVGDPDRESFGAFVIGLVELGPGSLLIPDTTRLFLTTGMMGGLTTYSTFSYETVRLMEIGAWHQAWINICVTTVICLCLYFLGIACGRLLLSVRG